MRYLGEVISLDGQDFSVASYSKREKELLQPRLYKAGYSLITWHDGEIDSFGPLTRICKAVSPEGEPVEFYYG